VVIVTGASAGIGAATARALATEGYRLVLVARRTDRLACVAQDVIEHGGQALTMTLELEHPAAPRNVIERTLDHWGRIDVLINNAACGLPFYFAASRPEELAHQLRLNLEVPLLLTRLALPHLIGSRGHVVNIGSAVTRVANPVFGAYGTTKAGLSYFSDALRREVLHRGVHVSYVELGPVDTEFFAAVEALSPGSEPLGTSPPTDYLYNPMRDRPLPILSTTSDEVARRLVRLLRRPRARMAVPRRIVWPMRAIGAFFAVFPYLGDLAINAMIRRVERERSTVLSSTLWPSNGASVKRRD
jgi:short-subunit dehydrogenase